MKKYFYLFCCILFGFFFFTYKITSIPPGLETDEASIAYNSALISTNLRDQNNRFLPIFILSSDKTDWKQPVLIYFTAFLFRIFGKSLFIYKLSTIIISLLSAIVLYFIVKILFKSKKYAIVGFLVYITTPIIFITTRIGNESILPSLISTLWLFSLILYKKNKKYFNLILNAIIIGIGFYSFKGMRLITPVWSIISFFYIYRINWIKNKSIKNNIFNSKNTKQIIIFCFVLLPFYLITPLLENKYAGAVFDHQNISISSITNFFYYWLSNISFSFWFTTPDIGRVYTISEFGAFPLLFLPLFIIGIISSINKKTYLRFILICYLFTPVFFGIAHSINYTHRLIAVIPFIIIIILYGFKNILDFLKNKKNRFPIYLLFFILLIINTFNFYKFYFIDYPKLNTTKEAFGKYTFSSFKILSKLANELNFITYVEENIYNSEGDENRFYNLIYFQNKIKVWDSKELIPNKSILLTYNEKIDGFETYDANLPNNMHILIKK